MTPAELAPSGLLPLTIIASGGATGKTGQELPNLRNIIQTTGCRPAAGGAAKALT